MTRCARGQQREGAVSRCAWIECSPGVDVRHRGARRLARVKGTLDGRCFLSALLLFVATAATSQLCALEMAVSITVPQEVLTTTGRLDDVVLVEQSEVGDPARCGCYNGGKRSEECAGNERRVVASKGEVRPSLRARHVVEGQMLIIMHPHRAVGIEMKAVRTAVSVKAQHCHGVLVEHTAHHDKAVALKRLL